MVDAYHRVIVMMTKHVFIKTFIVTSAGECAEVQVCEKCGATEEDQDIERCIIFDWPQQYDTRYLEKALKALKALVASEARQTPLDETRCRNFSG